MLHSFFKSIIFISTGGVILSNSGGQEFRYRIILLNMKISFLSMLVRIMCLSGFPFMLGFYSKDLILIGGFRLTGFFRLLFFFLGCFVTILYRIRFLIDFYIIYFLRCPLIKVVNVKIFFYSLVFLVRVCLNFGSFLEILVVDSFFLVRGMDVAMGLILIIFSFVFLFLFNFRKILISLSTGLFYVEWLSRGGFTSVIVLFNVHRFELS